MKTKFLSGPENCHVAVAVNALAAATTPAAAAAAVLTANRLSDWAPIGRGDSVTSTPIGRRGRGRER